MESYSAIKKNDIVKFSGKRIKPGKIILDIQSFPEMIFKIRSIY